MQRFRQNHPAQENLRRDRASLMPAYARYPVVMERGEGVYLWDSSGNRYLDLMAGLGVNAVGHAHPRMRRAMADQAARLVHLSPQYCSPLAGDLAERLCDLSGMAGAFFSTGGSEAVEGALKLARVYAHEHFSPAKYRIVSLQGSYHGRTFGSMSVTGQSKYRNGFEPGLPGVNFVVREDMEQLRTAVTDETCAILIEPVLGEGGVHEVSGEYLREARRLADEHHALLIFDEIQCGLGRTGEWFAHTAGGVRPDVLVRLFGALGPGRHGSTLGGSPLACRMGLEFLAIVEEESLLSRVRDTGAYLRTQLLTLAAVSPLAVEARGRGLIQGLQIAQPARPLAEEALDRGVMLNVVQGDVLRFLPSFLLEREHVDTMIAVLEPLLESAAQRREEMVLAG